MSVFELWIPIVASGIAVHVLSTLAWTVLPHHRPEWQKLPVEDAFQDLIADQKVPAGQYMIPFAASGKECNSEEYAAKDKKCRGMLVLWATPPNMGKAIGFTLLYFLFSSFLIGYLASIALAPGATFVRVFQFVFTTALLTFCAAHFPHVFWFRRKIAMELLDGLVFALASGTIYGLLWPALTT